MKVFEVLAVTIDEKQNPNKVIFGPEVIIAKDEQGATLQATLNHSEELRSFNMAEVSIRCRPF